MEKRRAAKIVRESAVEVVIRPQSHRRMHNLMTEEGIQALWRELARWQGSEQRRGLRYQIFLVSEQFEGGVAVYNSAGYIVVAAYRELFKREIRNAVNRLGRGQSAREGEVVLAAAVYALIQEVQQLRSSAQARAHFPYALRNDMLAQLVGFPTRLTDKYCIYEIFCIIDHVFLGGNEPIRKLSEWKEYYEMKFDKESPELRQAVQGGEVLRALQLYKESRGGVTVAFFDAHSRELEMLPEYDETDWTYWRKRVKALQWGNSSSDTCPDLVSDPRLRVPIVAYKNEHVEVLTLLQALEYMVHEELLDSKRKKPYTCKSLKEIYEQRVSKLDPTEEGQKQQLIDLQQQLQYYTKLPIESQPEYTARLDTLKKKQKEKFEKKIGLIGVDLETCTNTDMSKIYGFGNQQPYLLCAKGTLMRKDPEERYKRRVYKIGYTEDEDNFHSGIFTGFDCVQQFVLFLVGNGFFQEYDKAYNVRYEGFARLEKLKRRNKNTQKIYNYLVAHNGFGFDFKYLYEEIIRLVGDGLFIGNLNQTKSFICKGIAFVDTRLMYNQSLKDLCLAMFPGDKSRQKIDLNCIVSMEQVNQMLVSADGTAQSCNVSLGKLQEYCLRDAWCVRELARVIYGGIHGTQFGHTIFTKGFFHSSAALSWEVLVKGFLEVRLNAVKEILSFERRSYIGGLTLALRASLVFGIMVDIKSSYPSAMYNIMPWKALIDKDTRSHIRGDALMGVAQDQFVDYFLYECTFEFPAETVYPSIAGKYSLEEEGAEDNDSAQDKYILCCLESGPVKQWHYGVTLRHAIQQGASIQTFRWIAYEGYRTHKNFIETLFHKRSRVSKKLSILARPKEALVRYQGGDTYYTGYESFMGKLQQAVEKDDQDWFKWSASKYAIYKEFYKLLMNSGYGKHSQKTFSESCIGTLQYISDQVITVSRRDDIVGDIKVTDVNGGSDLQWLSYNVEDAEVSHKGATVRFAAYITAVARANLTRGIVLVESILGSQSVCYCDTDSIAIELPLETEAEQMRFFELDQLYEKHRHQSIAPEIANEIATGLTELVKQNSGYKKLLEAQVPDIRFLDDPTKMIPFIPSEEILGSFTIEKFFLKAKFLGAKQGNGVVVEGGKLSQMVKLKGVSVPSVKRIEGETNIELRAEMEGKRREVYGRINDMYESLVTGKVLETGQLFVNKSVFKNMQTSVSVLPQAKIVKPTLTKRLHKIDRDADMDVSYPFKNVQVFRKMKEYYKTLEASIRRDCISRNVEELGVVANDEVRLAQCIAVGVSNTRNVRKLLCPVDLKREQEEEKYMRKNRQYIIMQTRQGNEPDRVRMTAELIMSTMRFSTELHEQSESPSVLLVKQFWTCYDSLLVALQEQAKASKKVLAKNDAPTALLQYQLKQVSALYALYHYLDWFEDKSLNASEPASAEQHRDNVLSQYSLLKAFAEVVVSQLYLKSMQVGGQVMGFRADLRRISRAISDYMTAETSMSDSLQQWVFAQLEHSDTGYRFRQSLVEHTKPLSVAKRVQKQQAKMLDQVVQAGLVSAEIQRVEKKSKIFNLYCFDLDKKYKVPEMRMLAACRRVHGEGFLKHEAGDRHGRFDKYPKMYRQILGDLVAEYRAWQLKLGTDLLIANDQNLQDLIEQISAFDSQYHRSVYVPSEEDEVERAGVAPGDRLDVLLQQVEKIDKEHEESFFRHNHVFMLSEDEQEEEEVKYSRYFYDQQDDMGAALADQQQRQRESHMRDFFDMEAEEGDEDDDGFDSDQDLLEFARTGKRKYRKNNFFTM